MFDCRHDQRKCAGRLACVNLMELNMSGQSIAIHQQATISKLFGVSSRLHIAIQNFIKCYFDGNFNNFHSWFFQCFNFFICPTISFVKIIEILPCSTDIQSVLEKQKDKTSVNQDVLCTFCEMAVIWIENQLRQNQTKEHILAYANEVASLLMHSPI